MRRQQGKGKAIAAMAGLVGVLALLNVYVLVTPIDTSAVVPSADTAAAPDRGSSSLATALDKKPVVRFQETVGRPLFNPSRRPVQRDSDNARQAPDEPPDMRLVGVMKTGDRPPRALLRFAGEQTGRWLAEGEEHNGWTLRKIDARSVVVESGGRSHEVVLSGARRASDEGASSPDPSSNR